MRVLVTRPEPASARTAAELERRGHEPVLLPLMQAIQQPEALMKAPKTEASALAVTSAEAMRVLQTLPQDRQAPYFSLPVFAVGRATARAAETAGFGAISIADGDGNSLAKLLISRMDAAVPIVYLTGTPRSPDFEAALQQAGYALDLRECYRMIPTSLSDAAVGDRLDPMPDAILVYSSETARRLGELHDRTAQSLDWQRARFLCLSDKIASALPAEFQARSQWPMEPREDLLLLLL